MAKTNKSDRFKDADWYDQDLEVIIAGMGGIGSWCGQLLARQDISIHIFDNDNLEMLNMGGQMYTKQYINTPKVQAFKNFAKEFSLNEKIVAYNELYTKDSMSCPLMISAFDNMEARKIMFENWKSQEDRQLFIDARFMAEVGQVYFITKDNEEEYSKTLFEDSEIAEAPCTYKSTSYCAAHIASVMVAGFNNYISNVKNGEDGFRILPFSYKFNFPLMEFNTEDSYVTSS